MRRKSRPGTPEEAAATRAADVPIEWILEEGGQARLRELASLDLTAREPITSGLPREEALRIYTASVNQPDTLFSFNESLPAKLDQMRALLHDPITVDEANALNDVLYRRRRYVDMIAWLQDDPIAWDGYFIREKFRAEEADRQLTEYLKQQDEDWAKGIRVPSKSIRDVYPELPPEILAVLERSEESRLADAKAAYLPRAKPCPQCGTPPEFLKWSPYSNPPSGWRHLDDTLQVLSSRSGLFPRRNGKGTTPDSAEIEII